MSLLTMLMLSACLLSTIWVICFAFCLLVGSPPGCARCMALLSQRYVIGALFAITMTFFVSIYLESRHIFTPTWYVDLMMLAVLFFLNSSKSRVIAGINMGMILALFAASFLVK